MVLLWIYMLIFWERWEKFTWCNVDYSDNDDDDDDLNLTAREEHVVLSPRAQNMRCLGKLHNRMPHISYYLWIYLLVSAMRSCRVASWSILCVQATLPSIYSWRADVFIHCLWVNYENFLMQMTCNSEHNNAGFTKWLEILNWEEISLRLLLSENAGQHEFQCKQGTYAALATLP